MEMNLNIFIPDMKLPKVLDQLQNGLKRRYFLAIVGMIVAVVSVTSFYLLQSVFRQNRMVGCQERRQSTVNIGTQVVKFHLLRIIVLHLT